MADPIDTMQSILSEIYDTLTGDETLTTAMGGSVKVYPIEATIDVSMPYLIHRIDLAPPGDFWVKQAGTYVVDIYSDSSNIAEILSIRKRIIELLDERDMSTTEAGNIHLWKQTDGSIPTDEPGIYHYALQFNIRFFRISETEAIVSRS